MAATFKSMSAPANRLAQASKKQHRFGVSLMESLPQAPPPRLSVVLPNFNHGAYIGRALNALLAQDVLPDEVVVIDDASRDSSAAIIREYSEKHPCIHPIFNSENRGVVGALQQGLAIARGTYVYLAAADDWVTPGFFARSLKLLTEHQQADLACADAILVDGHTGEFRGYRPVIRPSFHSRFVDPAAARQLLAKTDNWIWTGSALFRRAAVLAAGGLDPDLRSFADGFLARKIALTSGFCYTPQVGLHCSLFSTGFSQALLLDRDQARALGEKAIAKMSDDPEFPQWYPSVFRRRWHFAVARLALESYPRHKTLLVEMGSRTPFERRVLGLAIELPVRRLAHTVALFLLWRRWRPHSLVRLAMTALQRLFEGRPERDQEARISLGHGDGRLGTH
jgi:glycosyltransferase involved in cell wall biosynthesis